MASALQMPQRGRMRNLGVAQLSDIRGRAPGDYPSRENGGLTPPTGRTVQDIRDGEGI